MSSVKGVCAPSHDSMEMLISRIAEHEGIKKFAYKDSLGYITVGIGRCLDPKKGGGLSVDECFYLLRNDIKEEHTLLSQYDWYAKQDVVRQGALIELSFNLGFNGLLGFKDMIKALGTNSYSTAAKELADSLWAKQVSKARVDDISYRLFTGRYK